MRDYNIEDWLLEVDAAGNPTPTDAPAPTAEPAAGQPDAAPAPNQDPNVANQDQTQASAQPDDVSQDPQTPDMPEEKPDTKDFETWKQSYFKEAIKSDTNKMMELLLQVRDREGLTPYQKKFVEDNWNIQLIRQNSNVENASKQIRNQIRQQLDRNNPATSVMNHMVAVLDNSPMLNNVFIKLNGYGGMKGDLHRKFIAALTGSVQVGSGGNNDDLIYNERDYSIGMSTRFNAHWGEVMLGSWSLKEDDPQRYLAEPELKRLQDGSPQERDALRRRIVIESIAELFQTKAFIINVAAEDGTLYGLGWDISTSLRAAFTSGKLVVKTRSSDSSEAMIDDEGQIVPLVDLSIMYVKESGQQSDEGKPATDEIRFLERKDGMLFLVADLSVIKDAATSLQGATFKEIPYNGNPSDLKTLTRCVYTASDMILRQC